MSSDVERYVQKCFQCVFHGPAMKSQFLHSVYVWRSFQLIEFDFIKSLLIIKKKCSHIFHVTDYFFRFFVIFSTFTVNVKDVIFILKKIFSLYIKSKNIYCDHEQHFENLKIKLFFSELNIFIIFSSFRSHQNTYIIEIKNCLLENVFRKFKIKDLDWEKILSRTIYNLNVKIIFHLESSFVIIF